MTSALFDAVAPTGAVVLDLEQVVVRGQLTLAALLAPEGARRGLRDVVEAVGERLGLPVSVVEGRGDNRRRPTGRAAVVVLGAPLRAEAVAAVSRSVAEHGANIDRIRRLSRYPVTTLELDVSGADLARPAPRAARSSRPSERVDIAVARDRAGPARAAPRRHGRRLDAHPGRGHRAAGPARRTRAPRSPR